MEPNAPSDEPVLPATALQKSEPGRESSENDRIRELVIRIGRKAVDLTSDSQTDIDPSSLFEWKFKPDGHVDEDANNRQMANPVLPAGITIDRAVRIARSDLGHTNFIILQDSGGNMVCVKMNEGRTDALRHIDEGVEVGEDHREITVTSLRRSEIRNTGLLALGRKTSVYHEDRMVIGSTPEAIRIESVQFTDPKRYSQLRELFSYHALSDLPKIAVTTDAADVPLTEDGYEAIARIMESGIINSQAMATAISRKRMAGIVLTEDEFREQSEFYAKQDTVSGSAPTVPQIK